MCENHKRNFEILVMTASYPQLAQDLKKDAEKSLNVWGC